MEELSEKREQRAARKGAAEPGRGPVAPEGARYVKPAVVASYSERELDSQFSTAVGEVTHVDLFGGSSL